MSQIFNALQRSEAERSGNGTQSPLEATEVLRNAERLATTKWRDAKLASRTETTDLADLATEQERQSLAEAVRQAGPELRSDPIAMDERAGILNQFKDINYSISPNGRVVCFTQADSPAAEAFRLLGVRIRDMRRVRPLQKVLVTSSIPQEGKSMISTNLACTLASTGRQNVLLLEGDVRRPAISQTLGIQGHQGLCEWLQGERSLMTSIYRLRELGFWVMPAGASPSNALELLQSGKLSAMMSQLSEWFDTIVIDSPPALPLADTSVWARLADGIVLVTRQGTSEKRMLKRALEGIDQQKLVGAILNGSKNLPHSDYYYRASSLTNGAKV